VYWPVSELVHGYGSVCAVVTGLAREVGHDIATSDFEVFNRVLDVAIAESVTAHERERTTDATERENERIGALAHELRNALAAAAMSLTVIKKGTVGTRGATADVLDRSLTLMGTMIDRSLAEVRLRTDPRPVPERFRLADALDQIGATVRHDLERRNLDFVVEIDRDLEIETDRQFLTSAVSNLVQNALKYTRPRSLVSLRGRRTDVRGKHQSPGVGLGLSIAMRAIKAISGGIRVRDLPGKGCIFIVELPAVLVLPPPRAQKSRARSRVKRIPPTRRRG
jgi:signal transduction histidine kinase